MRPLTQRPHGVDARPGRQRAARRARGTRDALGILCAVLLATTPLPQERRGAPPADVGEAAATTLDGLIERFVELTPALQPRMALRIPRDADAETRQRIRGCLDDPACRDELLREMGVEEEGAAADPALVGEWILILNDLRALDRETLTLARRADYDILEWRLDLAVAAAMEPELSGYELALRQHTGERLDPEELHALGLREVARIREAMDELVDRYDAETELSEFLDAARNDARLYAASREELLAHARNVAARLRRGLPDLFHELPRGDFQIVTPGNRRSPGYMAWYQGPGRGPNTRGYVVLNPDPRQVPLFVLDALLLHEAVPGHHFQMAWTAERVSTPEWRQNFVVTVFVEGWGLYAESLGDALGVYRHPMSEFGRLNLEMWRAIRLVVDSGLHAFEWTPERAVEFFADNTALPRQQIEVEVDRYRRNPGQAVAYKVGEQRLLALRARAQEVLGPLFDARDFHTAVLELGPVPLRTLDDLVAAWIAETQSAALH